MEKYILEFIERKNLNKNFDDKLINDLKFQIWKFIDTPDIEKDVSVTEVLTFEYDEERCAIQLKKILSNQEVLRYRIDDLLKIFLEGFCKKPLLFNFKGIVIKYRSIPICFLQNKIPDNINRYISYDLYKLDNTMSNLITSALLISSNTRNDDDYSIFYIIPAIVIFGLIFKLF